MPSVRERPHVATGAIRCANDHPTGHAHPGHWQLHSYGRDGFKTELPEDVKEEMATRLLAKLFVWAREAEATQPLTAGVWRGDVFSEERNADLVVFGTFGLYDFNRRFAGQIRRA